jgi:ABC-type cobalt transport system, permease component CbiQ and related transporters
MYNLGQYIPRESMVHNRDPRVKIIGVLVLSVIILQVNGDGLLIAAAAVAAVSLIADIKAELLLRSLRPVLPLFSVLFLLYVFLTPGQPLPIFSIGPVQISYQGLYVGIVQVGRFILLIMAASILTMTTSQSHLIIGLERLLQPLKIVGIPSQEVAMMLSLALQFIPMLVGEMENISAAQLARGANFNPRRLTGKIRAIGYLAAPLAMNTFRRCDMLVDAMESRGYRPGYRTYLYEPVMTWVDYAIICVLIIILMAAFVF